MPVRTRSDEDPLARVMAPPANETAAERAKRIQEEQEAKRISDAIDAQLKEESKARKAVRTIKILLLGQSESGKSTTLKNFQILYTPESFKKERAAWRHVIQLNLVRSVRLILDILGDRTSPDDSESPEADGAPAPGPAPVVAESDEHKRLRMRLRPLMRVEEILLQRLSVADVSGSRTGGEIAVRGWDDWKAARAKAIKSLMSPADEQEPSRVIHACRGDIAALWHDPGVKEALTRTKLRMDELGGFFLNDLDRIAQLNYDPTNEDVVRCRLKTMGVSEWKFQVQTPSGHDQGLQWIMYDVGGARTQRHTWLPYFDDIDAIIFLAPISAFDQTLAEDPSVNRLEDSFLLWRAVCASPLLAKVSLVLFLNKCDILKKKLKAGVQVNRYVRSYGDRSNDVDSVAKYFKSKFTAIQREQSTADRQYFVHLTSVTDLAATAKIIEDVRMSVLRTHLKSAKLL